MNALGLVEIPSFGITAVVTDVAVKAEAVYQAADDPNDVTVTHELVSVRSVEL